MPRSDLIAEALRRAEAMQAGGARLPISTGDLEAAIDSGLNMLVLRRLVSDTDGQITVVEKQKSLIRFYANSIRHLPGLPVSEPPQDDQP